MSRSREAVIVEAVRTPVGRRGGALRNWHPAYLLAETLKAVLARANVESGAVDDVVCGCATQIGDQAGNIARTAALCAGFPIEVPGTTIQRACGSSQQALHFADNLIRAGVCDVVIAGGVETMTRVPLGASRDPKMGKRYPDELLAVYPMVAMGESAEMLAEQWQLSRADLDAIACESHMKAARATREGRFEREILPVRGPEGETVASDEGIRPNTTPDRLSELQPSFRQGGRITAGNSSQISDGAAALLLMSRAEAERRGLRPRARLAAQYVVGVDPVTALTGPVPATREVVARAGLALDDVDLFEINEAFASVLGVWLKEIGADPEKVNVNGGAIAIGHPLGSTGARLATTMLHELERRDARYGVVSMCCGGGLGTGTVLERLSG